MDIVLLRARILAGKESLADEWLDFLKANQAEGEKTLKNEKEHLEVYFKNIEDAATYLYMFVLADDLAYANQVAASSNNPLDAKHFEYLNACVDPHGWVQLKPELAMGDMSVFTREN